MCWADRDSSRFVWVSIVKGVVGDFHHVKTGWRIWENNMGSTIDPVDGKFAFFYMDAGNDGHLVRSIDGVGYIDRALPSGTIGSISGRQMLSVRDGVFAIVTASQTDSMIYLTTNLHDSEAVAVSPRDGTKPGFRIEVGRDGEVVVFPRPVNTGVAVLRALDGTQLARVPFQGNRVALPRVLGVRILQIEHDGAFESQILFRIE